jgi:maleamate amidohydrolase
MSLDSAQDNYAASGAFGASLGFGERQALVMVDFAVAYFEADSPLFASSPSALEKAQELLQWARQRGMHICHTQVSYDSGGLNGGVFFRKVPALRVFCENSPLAKFAPPVVPRAGEVIVTKHYASAFFGTTLASTLRALGVDCVVIAGMSTSGCVRATALDAIQHGFIPIVVSDACGDRHRDPHHASLFDLQAKYADVMTLSELQIGLERHGVPSTTRSGRR